MQGFLLTIHPDHNHLPASVLLHIVGLIAQLKTTLGVQLAFVGLLMEAVFFSTWLKTPINGDYRGFHTLAWILRVSSGITPPI